MLYTTSASIAVTFTIKPAQAGNAVMSQYSLEVVNMKTGNKRMYEATALTPASQIPLVNGSVVFGAVDLPNDGVYQLNVNYASNADLDTATSVTSVGGASVLRVTSATNVTIV